ncbi:hypothetical protein GQ53DRAFT_410526 [Thozetella sp. PMI_491]|nr:hypothetical protein GQ53DRAFT_410526 [Thozetella sp. PMI_491]
MVTTKSFSLLLLASRAVMAADPAEERFSEAAGALISSYVQIPLISEPVAAAASAATVTGDIASLITSALEATPVPGWFYSAIPSEYKDNIDAVISDIDALRSVALVTPTATDVSSTGGGGPIITTSGPPTVQQTTIVSTGTDSAGNPFTTSIISAVTAPPSSTSASVLPSSEASGSTTTGATSTSGNAAPAATALAGHAFAGAAAVIGFMAAM